MTFPTPLAHRTTDVLKCKFLNSNSGEGGGGGVQLGPLDTAAINRPIVPTLGDYDNRQIGGLNDRGNLFQCHIVHHKPHMLCPDANRGISRGKPANNPLSYGTAQLQKYTSSSC
jgi:hypothetical protein